MAVLDALDEDEEEAAATVPAGVRGELVWSDGDCRRHAIRLPDLARRDFHTVGCGVFTRFDNLGVRDGELSWFAFRGGETLVLPRSAIEREVGPGFRASDAAWLGRLRYAAVLTGPRDVVALFQGRRLLASLRTGPAGSLRVRASSRGSYFAVRERGATLVYDRRGRAIDLPHDVRTVAWSPDERWVALVADEELLIAPAAGGEPVGHLAVEAVDVDWRT